MRSSKPALPSPPRAVIYVRVSTKEQTKNLSLDTQRDQCEAFCRQQGIAVDRVFVEEGESAKTADRTQFKLLFDYCRENKGRITFVVVYNVSRFSRERADHFTFVALLKRYGITLRSATEPIDNSSTGKLLETILAGFAQFDNDVKADRTKVGMAAALEKGRWTFGAPLGYLRVGGRGSSIAPDPVRAPLVRTAFELVGTQGQTESDALRRVNELGLRTKNGQRISAQTFRQMLRNPIYTGIMVVRGWEGPGYRGSFEPIISEDLFGSVQDALDRRRRSGSKAHRRNHPDFPLRVFVRCGDCGTPLTGARSRGRSKTYPYYRCRKKGCPAPNVRAHVLEAAFLGHLAALRPNPACMNLFRQIVLDVWKESQHAAEEERRILQRRLGDLVARRNRVADAFLHQREITRATFESQNDRLDAEIALAEVALHEARLEQIDVEGVVAFAEHVLGDPARLWLEGSVEQRQRLQRALFPKGITYFADGTFGTAETSAIFDLLRLVPAESEREASPTGFEPVSPT